MKKTRHIQSGFTLVETLIALLIMGVTTAALLVLVGQNTRFSVDVEERLLASIVADNILTEALANPNVLDRGVEEQTITLGGRTWVANRIINETSIDGLINITIRVRREGIDQVRSEVSTLKTERQS